jgi:hypothetical protein
LIDADADLDRADADLDRADADLDRADADLDRADADPDRADADPDARAATMMAIGAIAAVVFAAVAEMLCARRVVRRVVASSVAVGVALEQSVGRRRGCQGVGTLLLGLVDQAVLLLLAALAFFQAAATLRTIRIITHRLWRLRHDKSSQYCWPGCFFCSPFWSSIGGF